MLNFVYSQTNPNYYFDYESAFIGFGVFFIVMFALALIVGIVVYIFKAIGVYKIAKNRGFTNAWFAFIPVLSSYLLGKIYDDINDCIHKKSYMRIIYMIFPLLIICISMIILFVGMPIILEGSFESSDMYLPLHLVNLLTPLSAFSSLLSLGFIIINAVVLYRIFGDYDEKNKMVFLVLSILFSLSPFFLFGIRNKPSISIYYKQTGTMPQPVYNYNQQQAQQYYTQQQYQQQNYNQQYQQQQPQQNYNQQYQQQQPQQNYNQQYQQTQAQQQPVQQNTPPVESNSQQQNPQQQDNINQQ